MIVIESSPQSRETLFQLLRDLARAEVAAPERLAAAREAIREGHLGPPSEAVIEDGAGRPVPLLVWAASWGDVEMVELLLERGAEIDADGADGGEGTALHAAASRGHLAVVELLFARGATPLAMRGTRESVVRVAHPHGPVFQIVRRAAKDAIARSGSAFAGLATLARPAPERGYSLRTDRGVRDLRQSVDARLDVLLVRADMKTTARALAELVQAPRREADVAGRPVQDARRLVFLYRLRGIDWTIVPLVFERASPWSIEHVKELAAAGPGLAPMARAMASATASRVIHVKHDEHTIYSEHGGIETRRADGVDELAELGVLVPPMRVGTDGYHVQLQLFGLDPSDVERVDVVVLQELGGPEVDRQLATAAPALVGAPTLAMPGLPPMVRPPPEVRSEAPPMLREPPPLVVETGPAPSAAPPMMREPPPMIAGAPSAAPIAGEPAATSSAPPPLVREPPPMVPTNEPGPAEGADPDET